MKYNVAKATGEIMLGNWVSKKDALYWLYRYLRKYKPGTPYPNGKGFYKDEGYRLISEREHLAECGVFITPTNYPEVQAKLDGIFYAIGLSPPNYPVPAIRHEFEFGWQLGKGVVLIHSTYGSYDG